MDTPALACALEVRYHPSQEGISAIIVLGGIWHWPAKPPGPGCKLFVWQIMGFEAPNCCCPLWPLNLADVPDIFIIFSKRKRPPPHKRFSKMISQNAKNFESAFLAEPHVAVMFSCRTLTRSAMVSSRTLQVAEPKALNLKKDYLAEPWNAGSFRTCPFCFFLSSGGGEKTGGLPA